MKHALICPVLVALVAGCAAPAPAPAPAAVAAAPAAPAPAPAPPCDGEAGKFAVGQPVSPQLEAAVRARTGAAISRVLKPGQAVTMEFNAGRASLSVDARNRVTGVRCG